jgi:hypothetical protein
MRSALAVAALAALCLSSCEKQPAPTERTGTERTGAATGGIVSQELEIGCAMCVYHMEGVSKCTPAAKVGEKPLLLEGFTSESEHALCGGAKKAKVEGKVEGDKLVATKVEILP